MTWARLVNSVPWHRVAPLWEAEPGDPPRTLCGATGKAREWSLWVALPYRCPRCETLSREDAHVRSDLGG